MNDQLLWFTTRAAGTVSLILLSCVVGIGLLARLRVESARWPRFLTAELHARLALMTVVFLALHIITAVVDPFTSLGFVPVVVPFGSSYRTFWLGLGTVAFELLIAVVVTSVARRFIGPRVWRGVHWLAYAAWPVAVLHGIGTGTDAGSPWLIAITLVCVAGVLVTAIWRIAAAPVDPLRDARRITGGARRSAGRS